MKKRDEERAWEEYKFVRDTLIVTILVFLGVFAFFGFELGAYLYREVGAPLWLSILAGILTPLLLFFKLVYDMGAPIRRYLE